MGNKQRNTAKGSIAYNLFMYLGELRRPAKQPLRQSQSKMELTLCLLRTNLRNLSNFNTTELTELNQLLVLKEDLRKDIQNKTVVKKQKKSKDRWRLDIFRSVRRSIEILMLDISTQRNDLDSSDLLDHLLNVISILHALYLSGSCLFSQSTYRRLLRQLFQSVKRILNAFTFSACSLISVFSLPSDCCCSSNGDYSLSTFQYM
ncbi:uncharacterized protein LOC128861365 isoform X2 [Anastrepha ludens]|uniref:uncharacterized protein LOC128861365 isoform X2 n=1 Tax=Anastrepha ludens TaxID=28586 RepID=UPI0023B18EAF|nr:uncharacterized protein LOC128861365 isoform X2 [Anastrepha ludens]